MHAVKERKVCSVLTEFNTDFSVISECLYCSCQQFHLYALSCITYNIDEKIIMAYLINYVMFEH